MKIPHIGKGWECFGCLGCAGCGVVAVGWIGALAGINTLS